jgi:hypothetical protein
MMKSSHYLLLLGYLIPWLAHAQITITSDDMFNQPGEYYRAYSNQPPELLQRFPVTVGDLIGDKGGPHYWDFSEGPTDEIYRYDYIEKEKNIIWNDFPDATIAERSYRESEPGDYTYILFDEVSNMGRKVFGFWTINVQFDNPSTLFKLPIVAFPSEMNYGDTWTTTAEYPNTLLGIPAVYTEVQSFEVDAYGFIELPELGVLECLRINSVKDFSAAIDFNGTGTFTNIDRQFARIYYWLVPGKGIAAQMVSEPSGNPVSEQFNLASMFQRMFETNKQARDAGCSEAEPVSGLNIVYQPNLVRLKWNEASCAQSYRVQTANAQKATLEWIDLSPPNYKETFFIDTLLKGNKVKLYRVISERNN